MNKLILLFALTLGVVGCGTAQNRLPQDNPPPHATPTPATTPTPPPSATPVPITCVGVPTNPGGQLCDQGHAGDAFYHHYQWQVALRSDGSGTFSAITETGMNVSQTAPALFVNFPSTVHITELHATTNVVAFCSNLGAVTFWNGGVAGGPLEQLIAAKTYIFNATGTSDFVTPQVIFPQPVPVSSLFMFASDDLCGTATVSWTLNGSFIP